MRKIFIAFILISSLGAFAQEVVLSDHQLNASILPLGLSYQKKLSENKSFVVSAGILSSVTINKQTSGVSSTTQTYVFFQPFISGSVRNYYNRKKVKKNNLRNNSGNYVGVYYSHNFKPFGSTDDFFEQKAWDDNTNVFSVGPVWGMERNYASGIHLGLSLGIGYSRGEFQETGEVGVIGELALGFVLFSK
ncbi:MAG: hypothetical protein ABJG47_03745 [Ekhidna sp.]